MNAAERVRVALERWDIHPLTALRCTPALALALALGLAFGEPAAGAIACGAALVVGFGVYQRVARSRLGPMLVVTLGMALSTDIGTVAGLSTASMLPAAAWWGFSCGLLPSLGGGWLWIGQQSTIFLLVAGSYPGGGEAALGRTELVLAGGALQILITELLSRLGDLRGELAGWATTRQEVAEDIRQLRAALSLRSPHFRFALRLAAVVCLAEYIARRFAIPNGYWIGMTAVLLMRMDFHDTWTRSLARVGGTVAGLVLAAALLFWLQPRPAALAALVLVFAMLCYGFLRTHYGVFSVWVSAYIVFLLVFAGLAEASVVHYRLLATAIGAGLALVGHARFRLHLHRPEAPAA